MTWNAFLTFLHGRCHSNHRCKKQHLDALGDQRGSQFLQDIAAPSLYDDQIPTIYMYSRVHSTLRNAGSYDVTNQRIMVPSPDDEARR